MDKNLIFSLGTALTVFTLGVAISEWKVSPTQPAYIGTEVARGEPDQNWTASADGLLQAVYHDHDPVCGDDAGYIRFRKDGQIVENYPVPTAPPESGTNCSEPVDNLWTSRIFSVEKGVVVEGSMGDTSSYFYLDFATYTPTPTGTLEPTSTPTATPVDTNTPTATATEIATLVATVTYTPTPLPTSTATNTPIPTSTATSTPDSPEFFIPDTECLNVTVQQLEDGTYLLWIDAVNTTGYIFFDGNGYLFFKEQPIALSSLVPGIVYIIYVADDGDDTGCTFQIEPTSLAPITQFGEFTIRIPFVSN